MEQYSTLAMSDSDAENEIPANDVDDVVSVDIDNDDEVPVDDVGDGEPEEHLLDHLWILIIKPGW